MPRDVRTEADATGLTHSEVQTLHDEVDTWVTGDADRALGQFRVMGGGEADDGTQLYDVKIIVETAGVATSDLGTAISDQASAVAGFSGVDASAEEAEANSTSRQAAA